MRELCVVYAKAALACQVDDAILVVRSALAQGMAWPDLRQLVKEERARRNPVALVIDALRLESNQITLSLTCVVLCVPQRESYCWR
jgi:hypothetical protein